MGFIIAETVYFSSWEFNQISGQMLQNPRNLSLIKKKSDITTK